MAQPYVGEIRLFAGNFAPSGWAFCAGQLLPISENEVLFQLIGTTYGGDGQNTFGLPDLRGRVPIHQGTGSGLSTRRLAESGGAETVTLTAAQYPAHRHALRASGAAATSAAGPAGVLAATTPLMYGSSVAPTIDMAASAISSSAGGAGFLPHENMAPFVAMSYIISLFGIFPSPN
jgi:microcystin-dependent protein